MFSTTKIYSRLCNEISLAKMYVSVGLLMAAACLPLMARAGEVTITVDAAQVGPRLSPLQHGVFFEEINHAGDGGLYAEEIANRRFAEGLKNWSAVEPAGGITSLMLAPDTANAALQTLTVRGAGTGAGVNARWGVANAGYWGIGVARGQTYACTLELATWTPGLKTLRVALVALNGKTLAEQQMPLNPAARRYMADLTPSSASMSAPTESQAVLHITSESAGAFTLRAVSLFPRQTYKARPNGMRLDLAQSVANLRPSFVRFPGGCYVEGDKLANRFQWKMTLAPSLSRPGHENLWGYHSTDGLGYHEYLQWCEDMNAAPLFVVNVGMSHTDVVPMDKMGPYVQDALDAIEYARGDVTTPWGKRRSAQGHPAPFPLRLLEIGNENGGPAYEERFALFYDAIKRRYPDVQLIANTPVTSRVPDMVDEHHYDTAAFFARAARRYDSYPRPDPKTPDVPVAPQVYVGEYAVTQGCGKGNLLAALGEAAFITGMERNADVVTMASYAPLLVNDNDRKWNPDAIVFNSTQSYGTPSYWVQQMFSLNRGDVNLKTDVQAAPPKTPLVLNLPNGRVGVGTWDTSAEFADINVFRNDQSLWTARDPLLPLEPQTGQWQQGEITTKQMSLLSDCRSVGGDPKWTDYTFVCKARKLAGAEGFLILFRIQDDKNFCWWNVGGWGNSRHNIEESINGSKTTLADDMPGRIETGRWYNIRVDVQGDRVRCYLDDKLVHDTWITPRAPDVHVVTTRDNATGDILLKVVNMAGDAQDARINIQNAPALLPAARALTLTSALPTDENTFAAPAQITPQSAYVNNVGPQFAYRFPAYSVTILRLKTKK